MPLFPARCFVSEPNQAILYYGLRATQRYTIKFELRLDNA